MSWDKRKGTGSATDPFSPKTPRNRTGAIATPVLAPSDTHKIDWPPRMSTPNFRIAATKYVTAGITPKWLLPIAPVGAVIGKNAVISEAVLGKTPGRYNPRADTWSGLGGFINAQGVFTRYVVHGITKSDWQEFKDWPTPNVGVLGRAYPGIDSDAANEDARRLIETVLDEVFGKKAVIAERVRGENPRRLYAFKCVNPDDKEYWVRTRHITYKYKGDEHKLDIIGYGGQYLIDGTHPSGDLYGWRENFELANLAPDLTEIDNADIERFLAAFTETLEKRGGEIVRSSGGGAGGEEFDIRDLDPVMDIDTIFEGLDQLPNTPDTFPHRDDFVSALAAIRAALGKDSLKREVEDEVYKWATQDPEWCDDDYFNKVWNSLGRVRVSRDSLDRLFRRNGIQSHVKDVFDNSAAQYSADIKKNKKAATDEKGVLLQAVADTYIFGHVNTRDGKARYTMRNVWNVDHEWPVYDWWRMELAESDKGLLNTLHAQDGYTVTKIGLANFLRDLQNAHPEAFYFGETRHPGYDKGEIFQDPQPDGSTKNLVNMRYLSQTIRLARKPDPNPERSKKDVAHVLDFGKRLFGLMFDYELDTMAYMAQTGDRPGSLLFLVGDQGVGKSLWLNIQMAMFDGTGLEGSAIIDGTKLMNESARRFIFSKIEGCRIVSIKELPEGSSPRDMAAITSQLKQIVDPGPEGDFVTIEAKGENARPIRNFARVLITTNYANAIHVEQQDRRIFYVKAAITLDNKPDEDYYTDLVNILQDPARLAAFWRYLRNRDIGKYTRFTAPPVSREKAERIVAEIAVPAQRHATAALEWLVSSERTAFDAEEFAELMTKCAENEYINSGGAVDARAVYKTNGKANVDFMNAIKVISPRIAVKLDRELRTSKQRFPAIYVMTKQGTVLATLMEASRDKILDFVDDEYNRGVKEHPWGLFKSPSKPDKDDE